MKIICIRCEDYKDTSCFNINRALKRGYFLYCKPCRSMIEKTYRPQKTAYWGKWFAKNKNKWNKAQLERYHARKSKFDLIIA